MTLHELLIKYKENLKTCERRELYSILLFSLQLPSICSRIEFPKTTNNTGKKEDGNFYRNNGKVWDSNIYKAWLKTYIDCFKDIFSTGMTENTFCESIYNLRNQLTHEGIVISSENSYYFTETDQNAMILGNIVFLPIQQLCEDMFDAAEQTIAKRGDINVSLFDDLLISNETYEKIRKDVKDLYRSFWNDYTEEDRLLVLIYDWVFLDNEEKEKEIKTFFLNNPTCVYEIWDFGLDYCSTPPDEKIICEEYNEEKSELSKELHEKTLVCKLTKLQYERMKKIVKELDNFSKQHKFDIEKYTKGDPQ